MQLRSRVVLWVHGLAAIMTSLKLIVEQGSEVILEVVGKEINSVSQYIKAKLAALEVN